MLIVLLLALGVAMMLTAVWLVRATRTDAPALAPLEAMGTWRWRRAGADRRAALLRASRPDGAPDPAPTVPYGDESLPTGSPTVVGAESTSAAEPEPAIDGAEAGGDPVAGAEPTVAPPAADTEPAAEPESAADAITPDEPGEPAAELDEQPVAAPESS